MMKPILVLTRRKLVFSLLFLAGTLLAGESAEIPNQKLFSILRSINDNELVYEARMTPTGFDEKDPIHVYWIMNTKKGAIEPLTSFERRRAYGVVISSVSNDKVIFTVKAVPKRSVTVSKEKGAVIPTILINEEEAVLENIFIKTKPGGPLPAVEYVEIKGKSKATGTPAVEKISKEKKKD